MDIASSKSQLQISEEAKDHLNQVSPSFCLAKWTMATIHLQQGETHSCYHPKTHVVPLKELKKDSSSLHNTEFKKQQRKKMLSGERPAECEYCWNIEDLNKNLVSDRFIRSGEPWSMLDYEKIKSSGWDQNINPRHLELSFSSNCQLKCIYCNPTVSSKWLEEVKQFGGYKTSCSFNDYMTPEKIVELGPKESNPYVNAFWNWWPTLKNDLLVFRLTGGEPLLSKETFKILDTFIDEPNPSLELSINSNLSVSSALIDNFTEKLQLLFLNKSIKKLMIYGSIDTFGEQAEYIRTGLRFNHFMDNVEKILTAVPQAQISFTVTYNALSVPRFILLLKHIVELRKKYNIKGQPQRIHFDTPYLRYPNYLSIQVLPKEFTKYLDEQIVFAQANTSPFFGFSTLEVAKLERLKHWMSKSVDQNILKVQLKDFVIYFEEHDRRRNTNFIETFPELALFYKEIKNIKNTEDNASNK